MKNHGLSLLCIVLVFSLAFLPAISQETKGRSLKMVSEYNGPVISAAHPDVLSTHNRSGFETGQVVKLKGIYHMFVNEMFERQHRDLRIAH